MQNAKRLFLSCAAALIALPPATHAADNPAQAKARQALEQVMNGGGAQPAQVAPAQPAPVAPAPAPAAKPAPAAAAPVRSNPRTKADSEAIARAREAMRARMAELEGAQPQAPVETPVPATAAAPAVKEPVSPPAAPVTTPAFAQKNKVDSEAIEKAREALRQKMAELENQPAQPPVFAEQPAKFAAPQQPAAPSSGQFGSVPAIAAESAKVEQAREAVRKQLETQAQAEAAQQAEAPAVVKEPRKPRPQPEQKVAQEPASSYKPLQAPAVPFSQGQQTRLTELLKRYQADEITPEQYHAERAKIIAQP